jgi:hypothetical protein
MIELRSDVRGCWAIPYHNKRRRRAIRLPDGAIVELPANALRFDHVPWGLPALLEVSRDGSRVIAQLQSLEGDLPDSIFLGCAGIFHLPSGEIAAVYGARVEPIEAMTPE